MIKKKEIWTEFDDSSIRQFDEEVAKTLGDVRVPREVLHALFNNTPAGPGGAREECLVGLLVSAERAAASDHVFHGFLRETMNWHHLRNFTVSWRGDVASVYLFLFYAAVRAGEDIPVLENNCAAPERDKDFYDFLSEETSTYVRLVTRGCFLNSEINLYDSFELLDLPIPTDNIVNDWSLLYRDRFMNHFDFWRIHVLRSWVERSWVENEDEERRVHRIFQSVSCLYAANEVHRFFNKTTPRALSWAYLLSLVCEDLFGGTCCLWAQCAAGCLES